MNRRPLYSRSSKARSQQGTQGLAGVRADSAPVFVADDEARPPLRALVAARWRRFAERHRTGVVIAASVCVTLLIGGAIALLQPAAQHLGQSDIDAAVGYSLDHRPRRPAESALAYANVIPSVVMVRGYDEEQAMTAKDPNGTAPPKPATAEDGKLPDEDFTAVGTGVVIDDTGTILTNLHVANAAKHLRVTFADGTESDAHIVGARPETDLAVLQPSTIPDDLQPATLAGSADLNPGDHVVAIGFPFGIGPSASAGVVSGLHRAFAREGDATLSDLIQFDAAANPGNSGGPLIDADGDVVGIVTAILNPSGSRTFAGIGFAIPIEAAASAAGDNPF